MSRLMPSTEELQHQLARHQRRLDRLIRSLFLAAAGSIACLATSVVTVSSWWFIVWACLSLAQVVVLAWLRSKISVVEGVVVATRSMLEFRLTRQLDKWNRPLW